MSSVLSTRTGYAIGVAGLVWVVTMMAYQYGFFQSLQAQLTDRLFVAETVSSDIIIIAIDDTSLAAIGQWPWERTVHARLLERVADARVVGFDVIFSEPGSAVDEDAVLSAAIQSTDARVVLPVVIEEQSGQLQRPVDELFAHVDTGFVNVSSDRDGVVRSVQSTKVWMDAPYIGFDQAVLNTLMTPPPLFRVFYHGPAKTFTTLSYVDVLEGRIPPQLFEDKTVLVGASATGLGDTFQTPFGAMPGVEIHANTIATMESERYLKTISGTVMGALLALLVVMSCIITTYVRRVVFMLGCFVAGIVVIVVGTIVAFSQLWIVPHLYLLLAFMISSGALVALQYLFESKERAFIHRSFSQYVDEEVVAEIQQNPDRLTLGGETKTLSILFSDIRGFTTISEQLSPQELMTQLNEYLAAMSDAIMDRRGLVDKYIGDAVMAFWGAPLRNEQHAVNACESVIDQFQALERLNKKWQAESRPVFVIGVGISTGDVVVGNMGSDRRFNYSIIGDEVNFAARIEGLTKQYGVQCLIGASTYELIKDCAHLPTRELDDIVVKGKKEPRRIYELLTTSVNAKVLEHFAKGRRAYVAGDFVAAVDAFAEAVQCDPDDGPSRVFLERSLALKANPPTNWRAVYEFTSK